MSLYTIPGYTLSVSILTLQNLGVAAGGVPLLRGINFDLRAGEIVALIAPSGSGKTTLLRALCGLDDPTDGTILFQDRPVPAGSWSAYRQEVLLVEQKPTLFDKTVEANLRHPFTYHASIAAGRTYSMEQAHLLLKRLDLYSESRLQQQAHSLSVGQQQRLCLIRALLLKPKVLLLDEPTSALDEGSTKAVEGLLWEETRKRGLAILVVTHNMRQATEWCDRRFDLSPYRIDATPPESESVADIPHFHLEL